MKIKGGNVICESKVQTKINKTNAMIDLKISEAQLHGHFESSILLYDNNDFYKNYYLKVLLGIN